MEAWEVEEVVILKAVIRRLQAEESQATTVMTLGKRFFASAALRLRMTSLSYSAPNEPLPIFRLTV